MNTLNLISFAVAVINVTLAALILRQIFRLRKVQRDLTLLSKEMNASAQAHGYYTAFGEHVCDVLKDDKLNAEQAVAHLRATALHYNLMPEGPVQ